MPIFYINTNVSSSKIPADFLETTTDLLAKALGKPKSYMVVHVNPDQKLTFGGSHEPGGYGSLQSIGAIGGEKNRTLSGLISKHLEATLGIPKNRFYIQFVDLPSADVGYDGTTFKEILG